MYVCTAAHQERWIAKKGYLQNGAASKARKVRLPVLILRARVSAIHQQLDMLGWVEGISDLHVQRCCMTVSAGKP